MDAGLDACDEHVQLAVTLASAYFERGDTGHAVRICRTAVARAEQLGSPTARASAYWNTAIMESHRGDTAAAVPLAERALALLGEGKDTRNLARLRQQLGTMQLSLDPPAVDDARRNLEQAAREYEWARATPVDIAKNDLSLARARYLAGDAERARTQRAGVRGRRGRRPARCRGREIHGGAGPDRARRGGAATWPTAPPSASSPASAQTAAPHSSGSSWRHCSTSWVMERLPDMRTAAPQRLWDCGSARRAPSAAPSSEDWADGGPTTTPHGAQQHQVSFSFWTTPAPPLPLVGLASAGPAIPIVQSR